MTDNTPQLAYKNEMFLDSSSARPLRILGEYLEPLDHFRRARVHDTVVFFGSARITEEGPLANYYADARALAAALTRWSRELGGDHARFVVCSGGGPGLMEAANRGAVEAGGKTIGLNIGLPHEQRPNPYITAALNFEFRYFFMRKFWFAYLARALVVFPGGFGTLDELTELLTLSQTGKLTRRIPIVLYGKSLWNEVLNFDALLRHGLISQQDLELFEFADSPAEALSCLQRVLAPAVSEKPSPESPAFACSCDRHTHDALAAAGPMPCCKRSDAQEGSASP
jgi:uncharacterized protein (TIGR00730 family)